MQIFFRTPHRALAPFVESIWYCASDNPNLRERILPSGRMELLVNLDEDELRAYHGPDLEQVERMGGAALCGAWARSFGIDGAEQHRIVGVSFLAGGAAPFFGLPAHVVAEQHVEIAELWGDEGGVLRERLLEAPSPAAALRTLERVLLGRAAGSLEPDSTLRFAV